VRRELWRAAVARLLGRRYFDEAYFERRFRVVDPWGFEHRAYEATKYARTLAALSRPRYSCALEMGCAEGVFTMQLAHHADALLAVDIADTALERARVRLRSIPHVRLQRHDVFADSLLGRFDLVVCSEVLCFAESSTALDDAIRRTLEMTIPGGEIVLTHLRIEREHRAGWDAADLLFGADSIHGRFARLAELEHVEHLVEEKYLIDTFRRR
jgi:2-polyprenyl-3-methyl-5-hydroxy-6-metoxy-1,4-benzoquinol methylase